MSGRQAKRERADARDAYVRQFFLAYIRRLRGILKRLRPTAEPLQDGSCVLARIHLKPAIESGLDAVVQIVQLLIGEGADRMVARYASGVAVEDGAVARLFGGGG